MDLVIGIARVHPLWRITGEEIFVECETRDALQHRNALFFCGARINSALIDDQITFFEGRTHGFGRFFEGRQIRLFVHING